MERLLDELLALILDKFDDPSDRKSCSQVCKYWLRIEGIYRSSLRVFEPELILNFLPRFPNLIRFQSSMPIRNPLIQFVAGTCPRIQVLDLNCMEPDSLCCEIAGAGDIDDEGLSDIARGCPNLETVLLRRRTGIGDLGVSALLGFSRNLRNLELGFCWRVSDEALESIGGMRNLETLSLRRCWLVTDSGLSLLGEGCLCRTLRKLNIAECDRITDGGLMSLKGMCCLEELSLSGCGPDVTDIGIAAAVSKLRGLKRLNLSWLVNLTSVTLEVLARGCGHLESLDVSGCGMISTGGIRAFAGHGSLKELVWRDCENGIDDHDLEYLVLGCSSLKRIVLDKRLMLWIDMGCQAKILGQNCVLEWG